MTKNMSTGDRIIRTLIAAGIFALILVNIVSGTAATALGIVAGVFLLTAIFGFCPIYALFRISSNKNQ